MADLPRNDLVTDEASFHLRRVQGRVPQLHPASAPSTVADDKHQPGTQEERVDSGVDYYSLESQEYSALSIEGVRDFLATDSGRSCLYKQQHPLHHHHHHHNLMDNRPVSYRSDSISASLQNQLRNLSLTDASSEHHDQTRKDSVRSSRCDSGICDSGICDSGCSFSAVEEEAEDPRYPVLEAAFPECGLTSAGQFDSTFNHQELQELFSPDEDGDTYLHMSIIHLLPDVSLKVIAAVSHPDLLSLPNCLRQTPLHLAVATRQPLVARSLMAAGASLEAPDHQGNTPLHMACREGMVDMAELLLTPVQRQEEEALLGACQYPQSTSHVQRGTGSIQDLALRNYEGYTCAHLALQGGHLNVLQLLLARGANINEPDGKSGRTLLHMAADLGFLPALQLLLRQRGLQLDARTYGGLTAVTLAHGRQLNHVVDLLHWAGADCSQIAAGNQESGGESSSDEDMNDRVYDDICINGRPVQIS